MYSTQSFTKGAKLFQNIFLSFVRIFSSECEIHKLNVAIT